jgi:cell fate regulator YaaT (PSP1 superfamily)
MINRGAGIHVRDFVVADVDKGSDIGMVTAIGPLAELKKGSTEGHHIIRKANSEDLEKTARLRNDEKEAFRVCVEKIAHYALEMNLTEVEKQFDESKITFYFLADQRVDFRELVKDLASTFRTRIELRQIGVRDEAKRVGGIGVCGLMLCCTSYLRNFEQISTQMARAQHLAINQSKLSGSCGRLKCCLKYELAFYEEMNRLLPDIGSTLVTEKGPATVTGVNVLKNLIKVQYAETGTEELIAPPDTPPSPPLLKKEGGRGGTSH